MNSIEKQIRDTYEKAFYDSIDNEINSKNPDYDWIVSLYSEIKNRIIKYVKKTSRYKGLYVLKIKDMPIQYQEPYLRGKSY